MRVGVGTGAWGGILLNSTLANMATVVVQLSPFEMSRKVPGFDGPTMKRARQHA